MNAAGGTDPEAAGRPISVSRLVARLKELVEGGIPILLVEGEVSNFTLAGSGHAYFSLKDSRSQIPVVMFRQNFALLRFRPRDGEQVVIRGKLTVYGPRGSCQLQALGMVPRGKGDLQLAFEQLKKKLGEEGLFDPERKRPIPPFPARVGVVTSPTGAAIRDILQVLSRRFSGLRVLLYPVRVQGAGAGEEIARAVEELGGMGEADVLIVGRGGGSAEDLWAFNEEVLARALAASPIPVISAVGHETDWTIADLVADCRAPTPSAAAEMVVGRKADLAAALMAADGRLDLAFRRILENRRSRVRLAAGSWALREPERLAAECRQRLDEFMARLDRAVSLLSAAGRGRLQAAAAGLEREFPRRLREHSRRLESLNLRLQTVSPLAVLDRGYAVVVRERDGAVPRRGADLAVGEKIRGKLAKGGFSARVESVN